jgi:trans-aconitate 2-methyltransferase
LLRGRYVRLGHVLVPGTGTCPYRTPARPARLRLPVVEDEHTYSLGDSELAAERLALVARIFAPALRSFLERAAPRRPALALDLGCGPGHTTELLAEIARPGRTVGIDISESFLEQARRRADARLEFARHDVKVVPFPARPAGLIFSRLLLGHLPGPEALIARWAEELVPGGVLLCDEVERIESSVEEFSRYMALVEARFRASGGDLYVGSRLAAVREGAGFRRRSSDLVEVAPPTADAAAMARMNLHVMRSAGRLDGLAPPAELDRIDQGLDELTRSTAVGEIVWSLRQIVFSAD